MQDSGQSPINSPEKKSKANDLQLNTNTSNRYSMPDLHAGTGLEKNSIISSNKNKKKEKDEKDIQIDKLKGINVKLRNKIKELNQVVEKAIDKANTKRIITNKHKHESVQDVGHLLQIRDQEILNAIKQTETNNYEIMKLQEKLDQMSGVDKLLQLEQRMKDAQSKKAELEKSIKNLEKQNQDQGKALDKLTNDTENHNKIRNMVEELRIWKEKVKKLEKNVIKDKATRKEQIERIKRVEEENMKYTEELDALIQKKKNAMPEQQHEKLDVDQLQYEKDQLKMEFLEEEKKSKQEIKQLEKKVSELNSKAEDLRKELKEKEQEYRISTYKLNELRRTIKHNQLKPLGKNGGMSDGENNINSDNPALNKLNLKKHNKMLKSKNNNENSPERMEKILNKFEEEDGIDDEVEKQIEAKIRQQVREESELDKNQTIPQNLAKAPPKKK